MAHPQDSARQSNTCKKNIVKIIIGKVETSIDFKVCVKQGDSMAPVLLLFLMMAFSKTLEDEWMALGLSKVQLSRKDNSPRSTKQLVSHRPDTFLSGTIFNLFYILYVDNGAFVFESSTNIERGITLLSNHFAQFGLKMYIGTEKKPWILNAYFFRLPVSLTHEHCAHLSRQLYLCPTEEIRR